MLRRRLCFSVRGWSCPSRRKSATAARRAISSPKRLSIMAASTRSPAPRRDRYRTKRRARLKMRREPRKDIAPGSAMSARLAMSAAISASRRRTRLPNQPAGPTGSRRPPPAPATAARRRPVGVARDERFEIIAHAVAAACSQRAARARSRRRGRPKRRVEPPSHLLARQRPGELATIRPRWNIFTAGCHDPEGLGELRLLVRCSA